MLCPHCHVHTNRGFPYCIRCGKALGRASAAANDPALLVSDNGVGPTSLAAPCTTIGRSLDNHLVLADTYVSRYHARIWRDTTGYQLEDLDSLNGTFVNGELLAPGETRVLNDFDSIKLGLNAMVRMEQPRDVRVGMRTVVGPMETGIGPVSAAAMLANQQAAEAVAAAPVTAPPAETASNAQGTGQGALDVRPRRRSGWALKQVASSGGSPRFVLSNTRSGQYIQVTERDCFLWNKMDGDNSLRDLLLAYNEEFGQLALPRIQALLEQLRGAGLVAGFPGTDVSLTRSQRIKKAVVNALMRLELAVSGLDRITGALYRAFGWWFFTPAGLLLVFGAGIGGLAAFAYALPHRQLFNVGAAGAVGAMIVIAAYILGITVHELGHALATKSYGRRVKRGGFMIMLGMPYAFVDTSDMWFEGRGPRLVVTMAGPIITAAVAGLFAVGAVALPGADAQGICFQVAMGLYVNTLFNFNPLIPLDGYHALADGLEMPHLRQEAGRYFRRGLWSDIRHRRHMGFRQLGLAVFGLLSVVGMFGFIALGVFSWQTRLGGFVHQHVPAPFDTVLLFGGLLLVFFPVWFGPVTKARRGVGRRLRPEVRHVEATA